MAFSAIVDEMNLAVGLFGTRDPDLAGFADLRADILDLDVAEGVSGPVVDLELGPVPRGRAAGVV